MVTLKVTSSAFAFGQKIPAKYTCEGTNINPPLHIEKIPGEAIELAVIVDDIDAPARTWNHWLAWNIPVTKDIPENAQMGIVGTNDFRNNQYNGPCPSTGSHRYYFKIYALDRHLKLEPSDKKRKLLTEIQGHILAKGELIGLYGPS